MHCVPKVNKEYGDICLLRQEGPSIGIQEGSTKKRACAEGSSVFFIVDKKVNCVNKCVGGQGIVPKPPEHI